MATCLIVEKQPLIFHDCRSPHRLKLILVVFSLIALGLDVTTLAIVPRLQTTNTDDHFDYHILILLRLYDESLLLDWLIARL